MVGERLSPAIVKRAGQLSGRGGSETTSKSVSSALLKRVYAKSGEKSQDNGVLSKGNDRGAAILVRAHRGC